MLRNTTCRDHTHLSTLLDPHQADPNTSHQADSNTSHQADPNTSHQADPNTSYECCSIKNLALPESETNLSP